MKGGCITSIAPEIFTKIKQICVSDIFLRKHRNEKIKVKGGDAIIRVDPSPIGIIPIQ